MRLLKRLLQIIVRSATKPAYYLDLIRQPLSWTFKYYLFVHLLFALGVTLVFSVFTLPYLYRLASVAPDILASVFPEDLVITLDHGQVSTNQSEPYFIPLTRVHDALNRAEHVLGATANSTITYLAVIDTSASIEDVAHYHTIFMLTKNHLVYQDESGSIRALPLESVPNTRINQTEVKNMILRFVPVIKRLLPLTSVMVLVALGILVPLIRGLYLFGFSLILYLGFKLFRQPFKPKTTYQINLHLDVVLSMLFALLPLLTLPHVPFGFQFAVFALVSLSLHLKLAELLPVAPAPKTQTPGTKE